jgi:glycosyltransferase involved in cell wall biosynthesis
MSGSVSIAVVILTHNDSLHLARALRHITGFAEKIFIIDSFSTDNTLDIAKSFDAQVLEHPFQNQARQVRWALDHILHPSAPLGRCGHDFAIFRQKLSDWCGSYRIGPFRVRSRATESSKESHNVAMDVGHVGSRTYWADNGG